jgi:hypothetical protein
MLQDLIAVLVCRYVGLSALRCHPIVLESRTLARSFDACLGRKVMSNDVSERDGRIAGGGDDEGKNERMFSDGPPLSTKIERGRKGRVIARN